MKFYFLLVAGALMIVGYVNQLPSVTLVGGILYIVIQIVNLLAIVRYEKLSRKGKFYLKSFRSNVALLNQLSTLLELIIFFFSAITALFFPFGLPTGLWIGSLIVAIGQLVIWLLSGMIGKSVKHVPIKMGFGGWYVQRKVDGITGRTSE